MSRYGDKPKDDVYDVLEGLTIEYGLWTVVQVLFDFLEEKFDDLVTSIGKE